MKRLLPLIVAVVAVLQLVASSSHPATADRLVPAAEVERQRYADSIAELGYRLYFGDSVLEADPVRAYALIEEAAEMGQVRAVNNLAYLLLHGDSAHRDPARAAALFMLAADDGLPTAMAQLADLYRDGVGVPTDTVKAVELYLRASRAGLGDAQRKLVAMSYPTWQKLSPDSLLRLAQSYYPAPAPYAAVDALCLIIERGDSVEIDPLADPVPAAATALAVLADAYARGLGVGYDYRESLQTFYHAALLGDPSAQYILAETLDMMPDALAPFGLTQADPDTDAQRWYTLAARHGITDATQAYRRLLRQGVGDRV